MEWLTTGGEVYHHPCMVWTHSIDTGKCQHCQTEIPAATLRIAREHIAERERVARNRQVGDSLKSLTRRFADTGAGADAALARANAAKKD